MENLYAALYLAGLASFILSLRSLPRTETERRGNVCLVIGAASFAAIIAACLIDGRAGQPVLSFMAGLAIALAVIVTVRQRFAGAGDPE